MASKNEKIKERRPRKKRPSPMSAVWSLLPACMLKDGMEIARQLRYIQRQKRRDTARLKKLKVQAERSAALRKDRGENPLPVTYPEALPITARKG